MKNVNRREFLGAVVVAGATILTGTRTSFAAEVPLERMFGYVDSLRTLTSGHANYSMQFGKYAAIPPNVLAPLLKRIRGY